MIAVTPLRSRQRRLGRRQLDGPRGRGCGRSHRRSGWSEGTQIADADELLLYGRRRRYEEVVQLHGFSQRVQLDVADAARRVGEVIAPQPDGLDGRLGHCPEEGQHVVLGRQSVQTAEQHG